MVIRWCLIFLFFAGFYPKGAHAQHYNFAGGLEIQGYPTGVIPGIRADMALNSAWVAHARLGMNIIRHRDLGVQDDERGSGYGFSLGARRYFKADLTGWFAGPRADLWFNRVDWENKDSTGQVIEQGTSDITVFQPTLEAGYTIRFKNSPVVLSPALSIGVEINVRTAGAPVGQGMILLAGISACHIFK